MLRRHRNTDYAAHNQLQGELLKLFKSFSRTWDCTRQIFKTDVNCQYSTLKLLRNREQRWCYKEGKYRQWQKDKKDLAASLMESFHSSLAKAFFQLFSKASNVTMSQGNTPVCPVSLWAEIWLFFIAKHFFFLSQNTSPKHDKSSSVHFIFCSKLWLEFPASFSTSCSSAHQEISFSTILFHRMSPDSGRQASRLTSLQQNKPHTFNFNHVGKSLWRLLFFAFVK